MATSISLLVFICTFAEIVSVQQDFIELAFPPVWNGDQFQKEPCPSQGIPEWLDGYFLVQTAGSYDKQSNPWGQKLIHLFDGIGAITSIELSNGEAKFSARYYPSRSYKIWDFYNRDLSQSKVAWIPFRSPYNSTAKDIWKNISLYADDGIFQTHTNIDFWRIGKNVIGATEHPGIGMQFNVSTLSNFTHPSLIETNDIFTYRSSIIPLLIPVHERKNQDDTIYAVSAAFEPSAHKMQQIVFKVTPDGTRTVEGVYEMGTYDPSKCTPNGTYTGDKKVLANYMHSISSTQQYVILPLTSIIFNPCKLAPLGDNLTAPASIPNLPPGVKQNLNVVEYSTDVPMKFLIFDKKNKRFVTEKPIVVDVPMTPVHQFNAYEDQDGTIVADLGALDGINGDAYSLLTIEKILHGVGKAFLLQRFRINLKTNTVNRTNILSGQDYVDGEFPNFNQKFIERKYKYGYMMTNFLKLGAKISKIDMDGQKVVAEFSAPGPKSGTTIFREPWFVPRPGSVEEDDGVVLALGGDATSKLSTLYVINAKTMTMTGAAELPVFVPLGLHNRFFFKSELGLPSGNTTGKGRIVMNNNLTSAVNALTGRSRNSSTVGPTDGGGNISDGIHASIDRSNTGAQDNNKGPRNNANSDSYVDSVTLTWGNLIDQTKNVFCTLFKDLLDKSGANFCNATAGKN